MDESRLEHGVLEIRQLIEHYKTGQVVIPEFQREYVWKRSRAPKLLDSLYRGFPVSSLLLWQSFDAIRSRRREPKPSRAALVNWLIDGQQRVITLSKTFSGDEGIEVVFNVETEEFALANAATRNDRNWYRVADIWEESSYRDFRRAIPDDHRGRKMEAAFERVRNILNYKIPFVKMVDHTFDNAVLAFTRINTLGVKLNRADIESAQVAAKHTGFIADEVTPFLHEIRREGYTRISVMHLFRVCAFIAQPDGRNRTPLHELDRTQVLAAWKQTKKATNEAISLIRSELGLLNMDILWSGSILVPVIALCHQLGPSERRSKEIAGWIVAASLFHRYSGASDTSLEQDLRACRSADPVRALLANLKKEEGQIYATANDFKGSLMDRGALLAVYVACRNRGIKDILTYGEVLLNKDIDRHHILPRGQFGEKSRHAADCVANMSFITGGSNKAVNMAGPDVYLKKVPDDVLRSQCIPANPALWQVAMAEEFWSARRELLADSMNDYLKQALNSRRI